MLTSPPIKFSETKVPPPCKSQTNISLNSETSETNMETSCKHYEMKKTKKFNVKQLKFLIFSFKICHTSIICILFWLIQFFSVYTMYAKERKKIFRQRQLKLNGLNLFENINLISLFRYSLQFIKFETKILLSRAGAVFFATGVGYGCPKF